MKILVSWLREFVDVPVSVRELADGLQGCGFEVASVDARPPAADGTDDGVIDLEVTTNRPDCLNVQGIAREVATRFDLALRDPALGILNPADAAEVPLRVIVEDNERCPRYAASVADVTIGPSPSWLAARLEAAGVRPISNVVDVTNYVMLELGQPLHAFDYALLAGQEIRVRRARPDEPLVTLDGVQRTLDAETLVIADGESAQGIAGVMGGMTAEVSPRTRLVAFESAFFQPGAVRKTARRLGMSTEASYRFERGANIDIQVTALGRVAALLEATGAGRMRPGVVDVYPAPRPAVRVQLRHPRVAHLLGHPVEATDVERILSMLGFQLERDEGADSIAWQAIVPFWRVDVTREADLIEEIARHVGYDVLPATFPPLLQPPARPDARLERERMARRMALSTGFSESVTFTFIERASALRYVNEDSLVPLANPLSEKYAVMRPTLLAGLLDSLGHNRRRERRDVQLFELGARMAAGVGESRTIAFAWTGAAVPEHWSGAATPVTFYDMKGVVETLCEALGVRPSFEPAAERALVRGRTAHVLAGDGKDGQRVVGMLGQLAPAVAEAHGLPQHDEVYVAEIDLDALAPIVNLGEDVRVTALPRYPSIVRDVSVLIDATIPAEVMRRTILDAAPPALLERVYEFARYAGKGVPDGQVSLSFRLVFRAADRTLTDAEVQQTTDAAVSALATRHGAQRR